MRRFSLLIELMTVGAGYQLQNLIQMEVQMGVLIENAGRNVGMSGHAEIFPTLEFEIFADHVLPEARLAS